MGPLLHTSHTAKSFSVFHLNMLKSSGIPMQGIKILSEVGFIPMLCSGTRAWEDQ